MKILLVIIPIFLLLSCEQSPTSTPQSQRATPSDPAVKTTQNNPPNKPSLLDIPDENEIVDRSKKFTHTPPEDDSVIIFGHFISKKPTSWVWTPPQTLVATNNYTLPQKDATKNAYFTIRRFTNGEEGKLEDNIKRWMSLFRTNDGGPIAAAIETINAANKDATKITLHGEYMGSGGTWHAKNYSLVIIVLQEGAETIFFKILGPADTISEHEENLTFFLTNIETLPEAK